MTRAAALSVLGLLHTVPVGFSSSPFSSGHGDRRSYTGNTPHRGHPPTPPPAQPGPTWDGGPHVEAALAGLELVLVVEQGEVGPGDGAVLRRRGGSGPGGLPRRPGPCTPTPCVMAPFCSPLPAAGGTPKHATSAPESCHGSVASHLLGPRLKSPTTAAAWPLLARPPAPPHPPPSWTSSWWSEPSWPSR